MKTSDFDYNLSQELIAQKPVEPRDHSRLMVVHKDKQATEDRMFFDIVDYLQPGDLLVWNNSKVFKARLFGELETLDGQKLFDHKKPVEIFLVREMENKGVWKVLAKPGKHVRLGTRVRFAPDFFCEVMIKEPSGEILVQFLDDAEMVMKKANKYGHIPVPPYIKDEPSQIETYQTVYAKLEGSVAAPTAGFHFTSELIQKLKDKGVEFAEVILHVGLGTFLPVKSENVNDHKMHSEWVELNQENADKINKAKAEGRRVVAVGTTTVRTLEGVAQFMWHETDSKKQLNNLTMEQCDNCDKTNLKIERLKDSVVKPYKGDINIFITPGFEFKVIDAMITNFHLPKSTLLMLVSAFVGDRLVGRNFSEGRDFMLDCYKKAVDERYRFFSFGDSMFIY